MPLWDDANEPFWDTSPDDLWDSEPQPTPTHKTMFDVNLNLKNINPGKMVERLRATVIALTGNAAFTTPDPALAALTAQADLLAGKITDRDAAKATAKALTQEVDDLLEAAKNKYKQLGDYVGRTATTEAQVQSAIMAVKAKPTAKPVPDRVEGLELTPTDNDGELDAQWDADEDASGFDVETTLTPEDASSWHHHCTCTDSRERLSGLPSGARVWVRVRARNSSGVGAWSDVAMRRTA